MCQKCPPATTAADQYVATASQQPSGRPGGRLFGARDDKGSEFSTKEDRTYCIQG
jgi:hypothetical protein